MMTQVSERSSALADFEAGRVDPRQFPHRAHLRTSYELLRRYPFPEALLHLARGLRRLAEKAGRPEAYHETMTAAFLALIAERQLAGAYESWEDFATRNPDLLKKDLLQDWYEPAVLQSTVARRTFVLPRKVARASSLPPHEPRKLEACATLQPGEAKPS